MFDVCVIISLALVVFRLFRALCNESGGKCKAGNEKPAAAAACNDWSSAAECSWALRRSSATELDRGSDAEPVGDKDDCEWADELDVVGFFIGQHEQRPGNAVLKI